MPRSPDHLALQIQKHGSVALKRHDSADEVVDPFSTDEWDPARGAFWQHAVAGSMAGVAEHSVMFPIDTMKTHMQVHRAPTSTIFELITSCGVPRLWRGVQTMFAGCIPAHAAYFTIYEASKPVIVDALKASSAAAALDRIADTLPGSTSEAVGAGAAVSMATVAHDIVMTPMDVMKQRLQLGLHKNSIGDAFGAIVREQGPRAFFVSLPLTLATNVPYAAVMGSTNEIVRRKLAPVGEPPSTGVYMMAGACSGALAAAATAPLDAVKTRLQTQNLAANAAETAGVEFGVARQPLVYSSALEASRALYHEGGVGAFYRGVHARMLVHAPSVAICWTSYETCKHLLERVSGDTGAKSPTPKPAAQSESTESTGMAGGAFVDHMIAGSVAGMVEHAAVFPIDTIKTHVQAATEAEIAANGTIGTARNIVRQHGAGILFRGLSALMPAIMPAHALMFSSYEQVLYFGGAREKNASAERVAAVGAIAGVVSTTLHDSCMVPAETIKQRLQLGYYSDAMHCFRAMLASGGGSFFRSLPTTLAMNLPYGSCMMMANESIKKWLNPSGEFDLRVYLVAGGISGSVAAGLTTPLDVIKTRLQIQSLSTADAAVGSAPGEAYVVRYSGFLAAARSISVESGFAGFWRGVGPRVAMFGPSCAVSWVAYESCKKLLLRSREQK